MIISLIWAMTDNRVIGINNQLPWKLPVDMKWFRQHTLGKPVIMGRSTFDSFGSRPLPDRKNIVISQQLNYQPEQAIGVNSLDQALLAAGDVNEVMIIGGASIYQQMLPRADRLYMSLVHADIEGDAWFPEFALDDWIEQERYEHDADEKNPYAVSFVILNRR
jgi:dihydrofolate reductase